MTQVVVVGGGISGLASAFFLSQRCDPSEIVLLESTDRIGGTIRGAKFGDRNVETGPDSFITRNPAALSLVEELGIADKLISPATNSAFVYSRSKLHPIPSGTVFGAPSDFRKFIGNSLISKRGQLRAALEPLLGKVRITGDTTVGSFSRKRWGKEVTERLIDPLVGGIHAGDSYRLSLAQCAPQYLKAAQTSRSVSAGLKAQMSNYSRSERPAFYSLDGGLSELVNSLTERLLALKVKVISNAAALEIIPRSGGYQVVTQDHLYDAEGIVCATPAYVASRLLRAVSEESSGLLDTIEYASPIMTLLSYDDGAFKDPLVGSGVLVPKPNGMLTTAITIATNKWPGLKDEDTTILRVSAGRFGDERAWKFSDEALVASLEAEVSEILGASTRSLANEVSRWRKRIPQFKPYHDQLVKRIREGLPRGIELAGAPFNGVGIPACITSGLHAADRLAEALTKPR